MKLKKLNVYKHFTFNNVLFMKCDNRTPMNGVLNLENGLVTYLLHDADITPVEISVLIKEVHRTPFSEISLGQLFLHGTGTSNFYMKVFDTDVYNKPFGINIFNGGFETFKEDIIFTSLDAIILKSNVDKELLKEYYDTKIKIDKLDKEKSKFFLLDEQRRALGYYLQTLENTLRGTK